MSTASPPERPGVPEVVIAVMGATGSGKSTFINLVSGSHLGVGRGLESCTSIVEHGSAFDLDGRRVVLIDTPGFDDTNLRDVDVLNMIASFLSTSYEMGEKLAGILYFHRISDVRVSGTPRRNFKMFQELCGENALKNVVVVTNMWGGVDPEIGAEREVELMTKGIFFKSILDRGGQMARHDSSASSAQDILRRILRNHPVPLRIQEELVDERKGISDTGAGKELDRELNDEIRKQKEEMRELEEKMKRAKEAKDEEMRRALEAEAEKRRHETERLENDISRMASDFQSQKERVQARLVELQEEVGREAARVIAQHQGHINYLNDTLKAAVVASEQVKNQMGQQIEQLSRQVNEAQILGPDPLRDFTTHVVNPAASVASVAGQAIGGWVKGWF